MQNLASFPMSILQNIYIIKSCNTSWLLLFIVIDLVRTDTLPVLHLPVLSQFTSNVDQFPFLRPP